MFKAIGGNTSKVRAKATNTTTDCDETLVKQTKTANSFQHFFEKGVKSVISNSTKIFGEMIIVANRNKIKTKFEDRGKSCIWLSYAKNHAIGTY